MDGKGSSQEAINGFENWDPQILGLLTSYLEEDDLTRLIHIGNWQLIRKLRLVGSVTHLTSASEVKFGFLLQLFRHLQRVEFDNRRSLRGDLIARLPSTVTWLSIWPTLMNFDLSQFNVGEAMPRLAHLNFPLILDASKTEWISTLPETIESMQVLAMPSEEGDKCPLPVSLTKLICYDQYHWPIMSNAAGSAPNLRHLEIWWNTTNGPDSNYLPFLTSLPQTLSRLDLWNIPWHIQGDFSSLLPVELREASLHLLEPGSFRFTEPTEKLILPSRITKLALEPYPSLKRLTALPASLTCLWLKHHGGGGEDHESLLPFISHLPRGLLHLHAPILADIEMNQPMEFPPNLISLEVNMRCGPNCLASLPSTITSLTVSLCEENGDNSSEKVVHNWKLPALKIWISPSKPNGSLLRCLATGSPLLSDVYFGTNEPVEYQKLDRINRRYMPDVDADLHSHFLSSLFTSPSDSESEKWTEKSNPPFTFNKALRTFFATEGGLGDEMVGILSLSVHLTCLVLPKSPFITDASITNYITHFKSLETLVIESENVTGEVFGALPRKLSTLALPFALDIRDSHIPHLPKTLTYIDFSYASLLTDECGPALPTKLKFLGFDKNPNLSREILKYLPKIGTSEIRAMAFAVRLIDGQMSGRNQVWFPM
jgi:hypothetical protein